MQFEDISIDRTPTLFLLLGFLVVLVILLGVVLAIRGKKVGLQDGHSVWITLLILFGGGSIPLMAAINMGNDFKMQEEKAFVSNIEKKYDVTDVEKLPEVKVTEFKGVNEDNELQTSKEYDVQPVKVTKDGKDYEFAVSYNEETNEPTLSDFPTSKTSPTDPETFLKD